MICGTLIAMISLKLLTVLGTKGKQCSIFINLYVNNSEQYMITTQNSIQMVVVTNRI